MKKTEVLKVKYDGSYVILFLEDDVKVTVEEIMEDFQVGETIEVSKIEMTEKEINELPEFDGF